MEVLKFTGKYKNAVFQGNEGFAILAFEPTGETKRQVHVNEDFGTFSVKGVFPKLKKDEEYQLHVTIENSTRYGISYVLQFVKSNMDIDFSDKKSFKRFLETIVSERIAVNIIETLENPLAVLEGNDIEAMMKVKGVGEKVANRIFDNYHMNKDYSQAYIELGKYNIDTKAIKKIVDYFKSVEKAIDMVTNNPYAMTSINGYGFKRCDEIFLKINPTMFEATVRIKAYIRHMMDEEVFNNGNTWIGLEDSIVRVSSNIGVDKHKVAKTLGDMIKSEDFVELTNRDSKPRIAHKRYYDLERSTAQSLGALFKGDNSFSKEGLEEAIAKEEEFQGWSFTGQQKEAIETMANNKVILLEGLAGSGKSTSLKVLLDFYSKLKYSYAQTALSGKASSNLALITGREGSTIHRLLGVDFSNGGFLYNERNKLPYDIIIIDEISMVDISIFFHLISAMRDTAKLILVGDSEQLEAIGVPVMKPLIESGVIPRIMLTEIHRQAKKSAVVTHSIAIREGIVPIKNRAIGVTTHGELQDLSYNIVGSDDDILLQVSKAFNEKLKEGADIMDIQIISPVKSRGDASCERINALCQKIYNPDTTKPSVTVNISKDYSYILRQGDKVINTKNNYSTKDIMGKETPVFNGSIGIVKRFTIHTDDEGKKTNIVIVDFEGIGEVMINQGDLKTIELAYCITIHKSQGMGVKHIIVAYPFAYTLISRQSLYTAITRTKTDCTLVLTEKTLKFAISKDATKKKRTYLAELLKEIS